MAIEFRCGGCNKLLRVGDESAGLMAKCPECSELNPVPEAGEPPPRSAPVEISRADEANPFAPTSSQMSDFGPTDVLAASRVAAPAIALMIVAGIGMAVQAIALLFNLMGAALPVVGAGRNDAAVLALQGAAGVIGNLFGITMGGLVLYGATQMKALRSFSWALAGAIIAIVPCVSPCCWLGLPIGIWAIVVLNDPQVKAGFRR